MKTQSTKVRSVLFVLCALLVFAGTAQAYDYLAEFTQMAGWLTLQQQTSGAELGGIRESETSLQRRTKRTTLPKLYGYGLVMPS